MERTLLALRPLRIPWRIVLLGMWLGLNVGLFLWLGYGDYAHDWALWRALPDAITQGRIYDVPAYVWSPFAAPVMAGVALTGFWPQAVIHIFAVLALRDRLLIFLLLSSFWFWPAVIGGNPLFTLTVVSAIGAFRGGVNWTLLFFALTVIAPRPVQLPLLVWILWQRAEWRVPFAALFAGNALAVVASGYLGPWIDNVRGQTTHPGVWYARGLTDITLWIRMPVAVFLTWRGHPGFAGMLASPYILQGYLLFLLLELRREQGAVRGPGAVLGRHRWLVWQREDAGLSGPEVPAGAEPVRGGIRLAGQAKAGDAARDGGELHRAAHQQKPWP